MIDLHCHILPGVDDGSREMEETIELLKRAKKAGFSKICFTPHYVEPQYLNTKRDNQQILEQVKIRIRMEEIELELFLGNEVFIRDSLEKLLQNGEIATLADTRYILLETPMYQEMPSEIVKKMLESVKKQGYRVVIAHPERYRYIQANPDRILEYFGEDVIFQGNYASIIGAYGKVAKDTIKKLLKNQIIHYLSSDVHHVERCFYDEFDYIKKKFLKVVDEEYFELMTEINPRLVIENKEIKSEKG